MGNTDLKIKGQDVPGCHSLKCDSDDLQDGTSAQPHPLFVFFNPYLALHLLGLGHHCCICVKL
jgi:hypothetical protein